MEIKLEVTITIDLEEAYREKQTKDQLTSMITTAIEMGLEETGFCKSCLIASIPKWDVINEYAFGTAVAQIVTLPVTKVVK